MSVYIKGMEMPTSCNKCRFFVDAWCYALEFDDWRNAYNKPPEGERLPGCPLIPVPEHGRLIDADEFYKDINESVLLTDGFKDAFNLWFDEQPTIIPADPADKEGEG